MKLAKKIYRKIFPIKKGISKKNCYYKWIESGSILPPPHMVKQFILEKIQQEKKYRTLIETGTYYGEMIDGQLENFSKIISVELSSELYSIAVKKYTELNNVTLYCGDSGDVLVDIMKKIEEPAIFWLDGHYSGGITAKGKIDCPIFEELSAILGSKNLSHVILIDDARLFVGKNDYPTMIDLENFIKAKKINYDINVADDIIKIYLN